MKAIRWMALLSLAHAYSVFAAEQYTVTDLGAMGLDESYPIRINSRGSVVGYAKTTRSLGQGETRPFIYAHGVMQDLHDTVVKSMPKQCSFTPRLVITDAGEVLAVLDCGAAGMYSEGTTFLYRDGAVRFVRGEVMDVSTNGVVLMNLCHWYSNLGRRGCRNCEIRRVKIDVDGSEHELAPLEGMHDAARINSAGEVIGWACGFAGGVSDRRAWLWRQGLRQDLRFLSGPLDINAQGQIVGEAGGSDHHAFLYSEGAMRDLGILGGQRSRARAINQSGQIVGDSDTATQRTHAFLWENGRIKDLNRLLVGPLTEFVTLQTAAGINDDGVIIASGRDSRRTGFFVGPSAYLLTPVAPDP